MVADYIFEKDKLFACLNLSDDKLALYERQFQYFRDQLPTPRPGDLSAGLAQGAAHAAGPQRRTARNVRKSEAVSLGDPGMPVFDGLVG
ncbi:MAG: hypothetical protein ACYCOX_02425 [Acidobacteriaceae bacterium]